MKSTNQLDLFRSPYHSIFVMANGHKSVVLRFHNKEEMRAVSIARMRLDGEQIAYCILCAWTGEKVISLETIYCGDAKLYRDAKGNPICR